jgi:glycosyltransferase involved in cell wall biosynthesis
MRANDIRQSVLRPSRADVGRLWIVIPAYNEESTIVNVVRSLHLSGCVNVCVVDDGSRDRTAYLARQAGAHVLRHVINLGQGAALQTGISYALENGAEYLCTFDADGQHSAESVMDLMDALLQANADVALGSRFKGTSIAIPRLRRLLLKSALLFTKLHTHLSITDTHNGLRLLTKRAAQEITIEQSAMAHASEILQKIYLLKLAYVEVGVNVTYTDYSKGKGQSGFDSVKILLDLLYRALARVS